MSMGPLQIVLILLVVIIIFGAGKLPRVMGDLAKGIKNFKSGLKDEENADLKDEEHKSANAQVSKSETPASTESKDGSPQG